jgi:hypothetical protein
MRTIKTFLLMLVVISFSFGQNLLKNGNFENITAPDGQSIGQLPATGASWTTSMTSATRPGINLNAAVAKSPDHFMNVQNDFMTFRQPFKAEVNTKYSLKFWNQFIGGQGLPAATDGIFVTIRKDTGGNGTQYNPPIVLAINPQDGNIDWTEFSMDFIAPETDLLFFVSKQARLPNTNPNNSCRMDDFSIVKSTTSSTQRLEQFSFKIFPNPTSDILNISAVSNINEIEIINLIGERIIQRTINSLGSQVNIANLPNGVYILKATIGNAVGSYKFNKE